MKNVLVTQYGEGEVDYVRTCVVQIPDGFPEEAIENEILERCLDEEGAHWDIDYSSGTSATRSHVERMASERDMMGRAFIEYPISAIPNAD